MKKKPPATRALIATRTARKQAATQTKNLSTRLSALTMKPSGGEITPAKRRKPAEIGVNLDPFERVDGRGAQRADHPKGKQAALSARERSLANLKTGGRPGSRPKGPTLTKPTDAATYVLLRASGVPPLEAVCYFAKGDERLSAKQWAQLAATWEQSPLTKTAWDDFHGGEWQTLADDQRTEVALRHHLAQCAYILYTTDITKPDVAMGKVNYAKTTILAKIAIDKNTGSDDRFTDFLKGLTANAATQTPAVWKGDSVAFVDAVTPTAATTKH